MIKISKNIKAKISNIKFSKIDITKVKFLGLA